MLSISLKAHTRACGATSGGVSDVAIFDPADFDFTQGAAVAGVLPGYTAAALRTGATSVGGAKMFAIQFQEGEAELTWRQTLAGCNVKYDYDLYFQLPENGQNLTNFLQALDAAACCSSIGVVVRLNSGKILVLGERYVNASSIPKFYMKHQDSDGTTGRALDTFNGGNIHLKGAYSRLPYEYTGTWASIEALM